MGKMFVTKRISSGILAVLLTVSLVGCQTMNENRTATGAIAGALLGATAGALLSDDSAKGAALGALAGAALGGGIGYMLQKQKDQFDRIEQLETRQERIVYTPQPITSLASASSPQVQPDGVPPRTIGVAPPAPAPVEVDALALTLRDEVLFNEGSSAISPYGVGKLKEVAAVLREYPNSDIIIQGYTSDEGDDADNVTLSQRRADAIRNQLIALAIDGRRMQALGMGESNPVDSNATEEGRRANRRVEIFVIPLEDVR